MTNLETIEECLRQIPVSMTDYEQWLKVGAAIKHEGGTVEMWDEWSRSDKRYKPSDCQRRWATIDNGSSPVTVATVVKYCKEFGGTPPSFQNGCDDEIPMDAPVRYAGRNAERNAEPRQPKASEERVIRKEWLEIEAMPADTGRSGVEELSEYIHVLFEDEDHVGYVASAIQTEPNAEGRRHWVPAGKGVYDTTARELLAALSRCKGDLGAVVGDWEEECGAWIRFNPLDGDGVSDSNITDYRYALVESDDVGIDEQYTIIKKLELPVAALVYSGGKSLHAIVRINAPDYREYQRRVDRLYEICRQNGLAIDRKNRNPSRLSRMPGVTRNHVRQRLVATNIGKGSWQEWLDWIAAQNDELPDFEDFASIYDDIPQVADCLIDGILRQGHKMLVSGPSKAGKSFLLLELAVAIAEGRQWLGWQCRRGKVLYVNLELDRASCLNRIRDIYEKMGIGRPSAGGIEVWNLRGYGMPLTKLAPKMIRRASKKDIKAVIVDPIYKVITGDENAADQMATFCNNFDMICRELGCSAIYCHHHSKGSQGNKAAQDRASGSGVFARDPDALIDLVQLDIDEDRQKAIDYKFGTMAIQCVLDEKIPSWREELEQEEQEKREKLLEYARNKGCGDADAANGVSIEECKAMTGWRVSGILREFPALKDRHTFFRYPLHEVGKHVEDLLMDCKAIGEKPSKMSRCDKAEAGTRAAKKKESNTINETTMAYDAVKMASEVVTTKGMAEYLGIDESNASKRLKKAGYVHPEGSKNTWIHGKEENTAAKP